MKSVSARMSSDVIHDTSVRMSSGACYKWKDASRYVTQVEGCQKMQGISAPDCMPCTCMCHLKSEPFLPSPRDSFWRLLINVALWQCIKTPPLLWALLPCAFNLAHMPPLETYRALSLESVHSISNAVIWLLPQLVRTCYWWQFPEAFKAKSACSFSQNQSERPDYCLPTQLHYYAIRVLTF